MQYTPENIISLKENEVFVFGSNLKGQHGGGAAKLAYKKWGAKWGIGIGHKGQTYAIPTKRDFAHAMPLDEIRPFVDQFIHYAKANPDQIFLVTKIGCGLAGYDIVDIAPLFDQAYGINNILLPIEFAHPNPNH